MKFRNAVITVFIAYYLFALAASQRPPGGTVWPVVERVTQPAMFHRLASITQAWSMFAPNPNMKHVDLEVQVVGKDGRTTSFENEIRYRRTYPYLIYSRRGKINRRMHKVTNIWPHYAAWVCREWKDRDPSRVRLVTIRVPLDPPREIERQMLGTYDCE